MNKKKLVKLVFYYDDNSADYLDGKNLEKWQKAAEDTALLQLIHGGKTGFEDIKFKKLEEKDKNKNNQNR